jgi:HTH-type transcriptional repressor of NAD biosynthesis genes
MIGLVLGKFYPLHKGHLALIKFALENCDRLIILVCVSNREVFSGEQRKLWLLEELSLELHRIEIIVFEYSEDELPNTSVSSRNVAKIWTDALRGILPKIDKIFSSEPYGDYLAEYMDCEHLIFDRERKVYPISSTELRKFPAAYWDYLPDVVKPQFVTKVVLLGTESTGKTTMTKKLSEHFKTNCVFESARELDIATNEFSFEDLIRVAELHSERIKEKLPQANKLLFLDTDIHVTKSYSEYLYGRVLEVNDSIEQLNEADLYLYLEPDCAFHQDGTRLSFAQRNQLDLHHKSFISKSGVLFHTLSGSWQSKFKKAVNLVETKLLCK